MHAVAKIFEFKSIRRGAEGDVGRVLRPDVAARVETERERKVNMQ
jgi:hypothetical protein